MSFRKFTFFILFTCFALSSCKKSKNEQDFLIGTWTSTGSTLSYYNAQDQLVDAYSDTERTIWEFSKDRVKLKYTDSDETVYSTYQVSDNIQTIQFTNTNHLTHLLFPFEIRNRSERSMEWIYVLDQGPYEYTMNGTVKSAAKMVFSLTLTRQ